MKVDIHLTPEALIYVSNILQGIYETKAISRRERSTLSIAFDLLAKVEAKTAKEKATLFSIKKTTKLSLKHHEADILEVLLIEQMAHIHTSSIRLIVQQVIHKLNQKLA